jgi:hypothetical protein
MKKSQLIAHRKLLVMGFCVGLSTICCLTALGQSASFFQPCPNQYSSKASSLNSASEHAVSVRSPDGQKIVIARTIYGNKASDEFHISYGVHIAGKRFRTRLPGFNGEVAWSPDSKAFAVSETEGGGGIGARVYVFFVDADGLQKLDVSEPIEKDFGHPVQCEVKVPPNTGVVSWGSDSSTLYIAAQVIQVSLCKCMGTFRVYEINLPSLTIVRAYSQKESEKRFKGLLGCELRDINDSCVKQLEQHFQSSDDVRHKLGEDR